MGRAGWMQTGSSFAVLSPWLASPCCACYAMFPAGCAAATPHSSIGQTAKPPELATQVPQPACLQCGPRATLGIWAQFPKSLVLMKAL